MSFFEINKLGINTTEPTIKKGVEIGRPVIMSMMGINNIIAETITSRLDRALTMLVRLNVMPCLAY